MPDTPRMDAMVLEVTFDPTTGVLRLKDFEQKVEQSAKKSTASLDKLKGAFQGVGAALGALGLGLGVQQFVGFLTSSVTEAASAEANLAKFSAVVRNTGANVFVTTERAKSFATQLSRVSLFSGDAVLAAEGLLVGLGRLSGDGLERATRAAADLAAYLGTDIEEAARKLAKAANGSTTELNRLGIQGKTLDEVLRNIESSMNGLALAATKTTEGQITQLAKAWNDFKQAVGGSAIGFGLPQVLREMTDALRELTDWVTSDGARVIEFAIKAAGPLGRMVGFWVDVLKPGRAYSTDFPVQPRASQLPGSPPVTSPDPTKASSSDPWAAFRAFTGESARGYGPGADAVNAGSALRTMNVELEHFLALTQTMAKGQVDAGVRAFYAAAQPLATMLAAELNPALLELRFALGFSEDAGTDGSAPSLTGFGGAGAGYGGLLDPLSQVADLANTALTPTEMLTQAWRDLGSAVVQETAAMLVSLIQGQGAFRDYVRNILSMVGQYAFVKAITEAAEGFAALAVGNAGGAALHFKSAALWGVAGVAVSIAAGAIGGGGGAAAALGDAGTGSKYGSGVPRAAAASPPAASPSYHMTVIVQGSVISQQEIATIVDEQWRRLTGRRGK